MSEKTWSQLEDEKYSWLYAGGYPKGNPEGLVSHYKIPKQSSTIDLGCGLGSLSNHFGDYTGVDVSEFVVNKCKKSNPNGTYHHESLHRLENFYDKTYDVGISADVFEHIPPDEVDSVLRSISKLDCSEFYFGISIRPSGILDKDGGNLHLTLWDQATWVKKLQEYFEVVTHHRSTKMRGLIYVNARKK